MGPELRALRESIIAWAAGFDARSLAPRDAAVVVRLCAQIEAAAASIKALAAARTAEGCAWQELGFRSAAEQLADQAGMSPSSARRALETGRRLADQPEVAAAAMAGELSLEQADAVSDGVAADPSKVAELIDKAKRSSMPELNDEVAKVKAANCDLEARRGAIHAKRSLRRRTDRDGAFQAHLYGLPEQGTVMVRVVDQIRRRLTMKRREAGTTGEKLEALDYDALMQLFGIALGHESGELTMQDLVQIGLFPQIDRLTPMSADAGRSDKRVKKLAGKPAQVMIRVDLATLLRGVAVDGELCEIAGYGPVPVSVVADLIASDNPFIIGILTRGRQLTGVYHHGRRPNAYERSALDFMYPDCAVEGCSAKAGLQYDHRIDFAHSHITAFDLLDRLCPFHHGKKTRDRWALVEGRGKRAFVPPGDARHPGAARARRTASVTSRIFSI